MIIKTIVDEDFVNYKKPSMFIAFPKCNWKCEKECGMRVCQNSALADYPSINVSARTVIERYLSNKLTSAIVIGGLEPMDSFDSLHWLIRVIRNAYRHNDDIVIYTGYYKDEILEKVEALTMFKNIIIKFGRFIPNNPGRFDEILGIHLASDNQYAEKIS